jgi:hypothetical protein
MKACPLRQAFLLPTKCVSVVSQLTACYLLDIFSDMN